MVQVLTVKPGDVLAGKYRVEKVLGIGGMGAVVAARHVELGTKVALKFLLPQLQDVPAAVARFSREARAACRLKGQHTAQVLDVGKLETGAPYLVMEHLVGRDLGQILAEDGPLPVTDAVSFTLQACESLAEAHGLGIVHRDLKPQNLFLTRAVDGTPLVKVLDFGLARIDGDITEQRLTQTTDVMGSPAYMSPEQLRGAREAGARSDIWSIGVCAFELLTGRLPFESRTVAELCAMILMHPAMPVRALRSEVPEGLEAVLSRCLEKDPGLRFQDVADLSAALEPFAGAVAQGAARRIASTFEAAVHSQRTEESTGSRGVAFGIETGGLDARGIQTTRAAGLETSETSIDVRVVDTRTAFDSGTRREAPRYGKAAWIGAGVALALGGIAGGGSLYWHSREDPVSAGASSAGASASAAASASPVAPAVAPWEQVAVEPGVPPVDPTIPADAGTSKPGAAHASVTNGAGVMHTAARPAQPSSHATPRPAATAANPSNGRDHI